MTIYICQYLYNYTSPKSLFSFMEILTTLILEKKLLNEFRFIIFLSNIFLFPTLNVNLYQFSIYIRRNLKLLFSLPNIPHLVRHQLQSI